MYAVIDGEAAVSREALHELLAARLRLPSWYGRNLDALYDCLTELGEETEIEVVHAGALRARLGGYAGVLLRVLADAAEDNPALRVEVKED